MLEQLLEQVGTIGVTPQTLRDLLRQYDVSWFPGLIEEIKQAEPTTREQRKLLGMLAGMCHDLSVRDYFGYGCDGLRITDRKFGNGVFERAKNCQGSGEFGDRTFALAKNCQGSGKFGNDAFLRAENCHGSGKFEYWAFEGAVKSLFFAERAKGFYVPEDCVVVFKEGRIVGEPRGIALGIGYPGDERRIVSVRAEDVGDGWDALQPDFPERFAYLLGKYKTEVPEWLNERCQRGYAPVERVPV